MGASASRPETHLEVRALALYASDLLAQSVANPHVRPWILQLIREAAMRGEGRIDVYSTQLIRGDVTALNNAKFRVTRHCIVADFAQYTIEWSAKPTENKKSPPEMKDLHNMLHCQLPHILAADSQAIVLNGLKTYLPTAACSRELKKAEINTALFAYFRCYPEHALEPHKIAKLYELANAAIITSVVEVHDEKEDMITDAENCTSM